MEAAALDSSVNVLTIVRQSVIENRDVAHIYYAGMEDPDQLDDEERVRFRLLVHNVFWALFNSYKQGGLTDSSDQPMEAIAPILRRLLGSPGFVSFWTEYKQEFDRSFRHEVDRLVELQRS